MGELRLKRREDLLGSMRLPECLSPGASRRARANCHVGVFTYSGKRLRSWKIDPAGVGGPEEMARRRWRRLSRRLVVLKIRGGQATARCERIPPLRDYGDMSMKLRQD